MSKITLSIFLVITSFCFSQTKEEIKNITKGYNSEWLTDFSKEQTLISNIRKDEAIRFAKINNLPITFIGKNGSFSEIQKIENGNPIYYSTNNMDAARSTRTNFLHSGGNLGLNIEGQNMTAYVWDGGLARTTHVEFDVSGQSKIVNGDGSSFVLGHATHVSGTIGAIGVDSNAKGMAPKSNIVSFDWNSDLSEVTNAASNGMLISNHSYGAIAESLPDWQFGAYTTDCKNWDNVLFNAPYYTLVCAAGNDGNDNTSNSSPLESNSGFDKLSVLSVAKNTIVVANGNDIYVNSDGNVIGSMSLNTSSSQGPTDDYRIKPDITGNGTGVYSPVAYQDEQEFEGDPIPSNPSNNDYRSWQGTSMASPNVAGSLLLLQQLYNQENNQFALSATIKGLALHTADDGGIVGPDAEFGWGYLNTKKAAEMILSDNSIVEELTLIENTSYTFDVIADGINPLVASISWTDPAPYVVNYGTTNSSTHYLVNDLDIRIEKNGTTYFPWKLTSVNTNTKADNDADPYEKVEIDSASGIYTITISHKGSLRNNLQNYSLLVSGIINPNASIIEEDKVTDFNIYPNPTNGLFKIIHNNELEIVNIKVFTIEGKEVYKNILTNQNINELNLSFLEKGIYYITLFQNSSKTTKKLIIK